MRIALIVANFAVELGHAGLALGNYRRGVTEVAHALLLGAVVGGSGVAVLGSVDDGLTYLLALLGDFRRAHVCRTPATLAKSATLESVNRL